MARTAFKTVNAYITAQSKDVRSLLRQLRTTIRGAVARLQESISYQIPAYKLNGAPVLYFAAWKEHYSLYPATKGVIAKFDKELATYEVKKATIRFPLINPIPIKLIARIAKFRANEVGHLAIAKPAG